MLFNNIFWPTSVIKAVVPSSGRTASCSATKNKPCEAKMVEQDWVEAVIGLGPNLFYNSPMESCIVVCNRNKPTARKHKVLFIDALNEVTRERAQSFLKPEHQLRILDACQAFADQPGFAKVVTLTELQAQACNLSIPLYVKKLPSPAGRGAGGEGKQNCQPYRSLGQLANQRPRVLATNGCAGRNPG